MCQSNLIQVRIFSFFFKFAHYIAIVKNANSAAVSDHRTTRILGVDEHSACASEKFQSSDLREQDANEECRELNFALIDNISQKGKLHRARMQSILKEKTNWFSLH